MQYIEGKAATGNTLEASQIVNKLGKYLNRNIDGTYKFRIGGNQYDLYFMVLYQLPREMQVPGRQAEGYNDMHEMHLNLNITTYQNKIRVNIIEISPEERTIGFDVYPPELFQNMSIARDKIYSQV